MQYMKVSLNRSATVPFTIMERVLIVMVEVDLCLRPSPLPTTIQLCLVDHWVFIIMVIREVDICLRPAKIFHISTVEYKLTTQGFLKKLFQGVCKEKSISESS